MGPIAFSIMFDYDAELRRYTEHFRAAANIGPGHRVLDIGCGGGQSTRDAARAAVGGHALGVDVSERMLKTARERAVAEGLDNVTFELGDAQQYPFADSHFDVGISRFGTMFFAEPVRAFTNIARALRPGARLVMLVWQDSDLQEWTGAFRQALAPGREVRTGASGAAFSLADPATLDGILGAAGFGTIRRTDLREPVCYGPDAASAYDAVLDLYMTTDLLAEADDERPRALERLRALMTAHERGDGVWFDARAWLITAHR
ncbi:methyltransferase domain-containing protein [Pendulispora rubella]|uniref:Methyltransferase domain-containing protein n=1 Tax=Pendulispora rubella TaxID=2741070 RepID=A0ABZ2LGA8_9BACT